MRKIDLGKIVSTHGIHGEIRLLSSFPYKEKAFRIHSTILIDEKEYEIVRYRKHKQYDMLTLKGYTNINQVLEFKGKRVYKKEEDLCLEEEEVLDEELLSYQVLTEKGKKGKILEIFFSHPTKKIIKVEVDGKVYLIPYEKEFIKKIDKNNKLITMEWMEW